MSRVNVFDRLSSRILLTILFLLTASPLLPVSAQATPLDAIDDFYSMDAGAGSLSGNVLTNDIGSGLYVINYVTPNQGSVSGSPDGSFTYTPPAGFTGEAVFYYEVFDAAGARDASTVFITVRADGTPPTPPPPPGAPLDAIDDFYSMDASVGSMSGNVLINDIGSGLHVTNWVRPSRGSISGSSDGSFTYTPPGGFTGEAIFYYDVYDVTGARDASTVIITVRGADTPPTPPPPPPGAPLDAIDDFYSVDAGAGSISGNVLANDTGSGLRVTNWVHPSQGTVTGSPNGNFTYTPPAGFAGEAVFYYEVYDASGARDASTVFITIPEGGALSIVALPDTYHLSGHDWGFATYYHVYAPGVLGNDSGDGIHVISNTNATPGAAVVNADGSFSYEVYPGFVGVATFTYTIRDASGQTATTTVTMNVSQPELDAVDDAFIVPSGSSGTGWDMVYITMNDVINVSNVDITIVSGPSHGTLSPSDYVNVLLYSPEPGFVGTDSFRYRLADGWQTDEAIVTITVTPTGPVDAADDEYQISEGSPGLAGNVLRNDLGVGLHVTNYTQPEHGEVEMAENGDFGYTAEPGFIGAVVYYYEVYDAGGARDASTVRIWINPE